LVYDITDMHHLQHKHLHPPQKECLLAIVELLALVDFS